MSYNNNIVVISLCIFLGTSQAPKAGTDVLLDLLSIGTTTPVQSNSYKPDMLSSGQDSQKPIATLDVLSLPSSSAQANSSVGASPMMDLLDGLAPSSSNRGKFLLALTFCLTTFLKT